MPQYAPAVELHLLDGANGFQINGAIEGDNSGWSVSRAGDINGDGFDDLIIGAPDLFSNYINHGDACVVFGKGSGFGPVLELANLDGNDGFKMDADAVYHGVGFSVSSAGDVNGDGFDDVIVGTHAYQFGFVAASYVVFGKSGGFDASLRLSELDGNNGFHIQPADFDNELGAAVSSAGDVNGDGFGDVIVGTYRFDPDGSYVLFGHAGAFPAAFDLSDVDGNNGLHITGAANGVSVSSADINGDGTPDILLGAGGSTGTCYVVFGGAFGATVDLTGLDGDNGFRLDGEAAGDLSSAVASAGDVNADGFDDLIIGGYGADPNGDRSGAAYVVFGKAAGFGATLALSSLDGSSGFKINGAAAGDGCGRGVASAGDFNGDGFGDVIVGANGADPRGDQEAGQSYVLFGKASGFDPEVEISTLDGNNGFQINGESPFCASGVSVSAADINSDGFSDVVVGAGIESTYVIFGSMPGEAVTRTGTAIANTIHGGDFGDTLNGLGGADRLNGHKGNDTLNGGHGEDSLFGGTGADTLHGGAARDVLGGGGASDTFVYGPASDSTGANADTVRNADFASDKFDLATAVAAIDATISNGLLRKGSFDADLAAAADAAHLGASHAVVFTPDSGNQAGKTLLIVDLNGAAGYQAGADLVVILSNPANIAGLGIEDFN